MDSDPHEDGADKLRDDFRKNAAESRAIARVASDHAAAIAYPVRDSEAEIAKLEATVSHFPAEKPKRSGASGAPAPTDAKMTA
jgi:hypothetical protein